MSDRDEQKRLAEERIAAVDNLTPSASPDDEALAKVLREAFAVAMGGCTPWDKLTDQGRFGWLAVARAAREQLATAPPAAERCGCGQPDRPGMIHRREGVCSLDLGPLQTAAVFDATKPMLHRCTNNECSREKVMVPDRPYNCSTCGYWMQPVHDPECEKHHTPPAAELARLREAAEKATPGPWDTGPTFDWDIVTEDDTAVAQADANNKAWPENAAYIATMHPQQTLSLLDALAASDRRLRELEGAVEVIGELADDELRRLGAVPGSNVAQIEANARAVLARPTEGATPGDHPMTAAERRYCDMILNAWQSLPGDYVPTGLELAAVRYAKDRLASLTPATGMTSTERANGIGLHWIDYAEPVQVYKTPDYGKNFAAIVAALDAHAAAAVAAERERAAKDWADDHTHLQNLCRAAGVPEDQVAGDEYGVPGISDLADMLAAIRAG